MYNKIHIPLSAYPIPNFTPKVLQTTNYSILTEKQRNLGSANFNGSKWTARIGEASYQAASQQELRDLIGKNVYIVKKK